jgi:hypothetical protein
VDSKNEWKRIGEFGGFLGGYLDPNPPTGWESTSGMLGSALNLAKEAYGKLTAGSPGASSGSQ